MTSLGGPLLPRWLTPEGSREARGRNHGPSVRRKGWGFGGRSTPIELRASRFARFRCGSDTQSRRGA